MRQLLAVAWLVLGLVPALHAQRESSMTARGTFDVKVTPFAADDTTDATIGRLALDKEFHGDLEAHSSGQMLGVQSPVEGSAGYVAMEVVTGSLHGRQGSFVLQHLGRMQGANMELRVQVVPDSGTGDLRSLAGTMTIIIEGGKHSYLFDYTLPGS
jgi:hypothetical protein